MAMSNISMHVSRVCVCVCVYIRISEISTDRQRPVAFNLISVQIVADRDFVIRPFATGFARTFLSGVVCERARARARSGVYAGEVEQESGQGIRMSLTRPVTRTRAFYDDHESLLSSGCHGWLSHSTIKRTNLLTTPRSSLPRNSTLSKLQCAKMGTPGFSRISPYRYNVYIHDSISIVHDVGNQKMSGGYGFIDSG